MLDVCYNGLDSLKLGIFWLIQKLRHVRRRVEVMRRIIMQVLVEVIGDDRHVRLQVVAIRGES